METQTTGDTFPEIPAQANDVGASVIEKHRKPRSDAGKPRGPRGNKNPFARSEGPSNQVSVSEDTRAAMVAIDIVAVKKGVASLLKATDAVLVRKTYRTAQAVTGDDKFAKELASEVAMVPEENELISELTSVVCQRHELLGRFAPEALLVIALGSYGTRVITAFRKLNDIQENIEKNRGKKGE